MIQKRGRGRPPKVKPLVIDSRKDITADLVEVLTPELLNIKQDDKQFENMSSIFKNIDYEHSQFGV